MVEERVHPRGHVPHDSRLHSHWRRALYRHRGAARRARKTRDRGRKGEAHPGPVDRIHHPRERGLRRGECISLREFYLNLKS